MRAALYTRVSTEDQAKEGFSLDAQLNRLTLYAAAQNWDVAGTFIDDGHSGRSIKRPAYTRMMNAIDSWDTILVLKMDRIHRNSRNFMAMMDLLTKSNKGFASVSESLDTSTAMGRFVMDIIQRIAQLESEQIGERVYLGMEQKARVGGGSLGKPAPFGYVYEKGGVFDPLFSEAEWVLRVFEGYLSGTSKQGLADMLNVAGVKTKKGMHWTIWSINRMLTNPVYAGALHWQESLQLESHICIVAPRVFDQVQHKFKAESPKAKVWFVTGLPRLVK